MRICRNFILIILVVSFFVYPISAYTNKPNDPFFSNQVYLENNGQEIGLDKSGNTIAGTKGADIKMSQAWAICPEKTEIVVAVIDCGIDYNHEDIKDNLWDGSKGCKDEFNKDIVAPNHGWNFRSQDNDPIERKEYQQHGTAMAGIIASKGNNKTGIAGVNWNAKIMSLLVMDCETWSYSINSVVWAINFAKNNNVKIIVCSVLFYADLSKVKDAIIDFGKSGGLFIVPAGDGYYRNDKGEDISIRPVYPASWNLDCMITVASTDLNDNLAYFSNYSDKLVDIAAPGAYMQTTGIGKNNPSSNYQWFQGTCGSISLVGGLASLIWAKNPNLTNKEVKDLIIDYADDIPDLNYKLKNPKRINAYESLLNTPDSPKESGQEQGKEIICYRGCAIIRENGKTYIKDFPSDMLQGLHTFYYSDSQNFTAIQRAKKDIDYQIDVKKNLIKQCEECNK